MNRKEAKRKIEEAISANRRELYLSSFSNSQKLKSADLTALLPELLKLRNLETLSLYENQIRDITALSKLKSLKSLDLSGNQISDITPISELNNLQHLSLNKNQISDITAIGNLSNLQRLAFPENQVTALPVNITNLRNLTDLYFDERLLKHSAAVIIQLKHTNLNIWDGESYNAIPLEMSSRFKNANQLINFYFKTFKGERRELNEAKVLVVGEANVGKTSLILRLIMGDYNPKRNPTKGIQIYKEWKVLVNKRGVQLNIWDFGGQEIMHATHQFFLTKRSLYILMLDATVDKEGNRVEYWLEKIRILGGGSPVLIVINKIDLHQLDVNQSGLLKKYPNIRGFYSVSCEEGDGLPRLKAALIKEAGQLSGIHDVLPASWFNVKEELEKFKADFISNEKYEEICRKKKVGQEDWELLITLLHDLGVVLSFREGALAHDTSVLNPEWVTQGVYDIINSPELFKTKGVLTREMLARILKRDKYPVSKQLFIVEMMQKFELCFEIKAREEFLVPDLLSEEELNTGNWDDSLRFEYQYNILFGSIISRFIVKMHKSISKTTYWRTGVVLEYVIDGKMKNEALVTADTAKRKITIAIRGYENTRREFLSRIREKFDEIYDSFPKEFKENVSERVPIPKYPDFSVDYKHLLTLEELGEEYIIPEGLAEKFRVQDLIKGIELKISISISATTAKTEENNQAIVERKKKQDEINRLVESKTELEREKQILDGKAEVWATVIRWAIGLLLAIGLIYLFYWCYAYRDWIKTNWTEIEILVLISAIAISTVGIIFFLFKKTRISEETTINWFEGKCERILYQKNNFRLNEYRDICRQIESKEKELGN